MKKFGRKLFLSGLALAATAATLSTSTYAWYVTNTTADVDGGTAATAGTSVSGNLLVAQNVANTGDDKDTKPYIAGAYSNQISLTGTYTQSPELKPVTKKETHEKTNDTDIVVGKTYYTLSGETYSPVQSPVKESLGDYYEKFNWVDVNGKGVAAAAAYQEVSFWVLSTDKTTINIATTISNTTESFKKQRLLNATGAPTDVTTINSEFFKDAAEALRFEITIGETSTVYDVYGMYTGYRKVEDSATAGDANNYFKAVMGSDPAGGKTVAAPDASFSSITVTANTETKITIRIWLEGTDADCFDSCIGQKFAFNFDLSV